jgi:hypothetical protein
MMQATLAVDLGDARALLRAVELAGRVNVGGRDWHRLLELQGRLQRAVNALEQGQADEGPAAGQYTKGSGV